MAEVKQDDAYQTSSEPRLFRKGTALRRADVTGQHAVEPVELSKHLVSGETGPVDVDEDGQSDSSRHRLQRQKAQSRKTFRFRKSRRGLGRDDGSGVDENQPPEKAAESARTSQSSLSPPELPSSTFKTEPPPEEEESSRIFTIPFRE